MMNGQYDGRKARREEDEVDSIEGSARLQARQAWRLEWPRLAEAIAGALARGDSEEEALRSLAPAPEAKGMQEDGRMFRHHEVYNRVGEILDQLRRDAIRAAFRNHP